MLSPVSTSHGHVTNGGQLAFLRRVATDSGFRAALESDPQKALAEYGLHLAPEEMPEHVELPSEELVKASYVDVGDDPTDTRGRWFGYLGG